MRSGVRERVQEDALWFSTCCLPPHHHVLPVPHAPRVPTDISPNPLHMAMGGVASVTGPGLRRCRCGLLPSAGNSPTPTPDPTLPRATPADTHHYLWLTHHLLLQLS